MRTELKYYLTMRQYYLLKNVFDQVMERDAYSLHGPYTVTSLYFDDSNNTDYKDSLSGISDRKKHRIRFYNQNFDFIKFEKKVKRQYKSSKQSFEISQFEFEGLLQGDAEFLNSKNTLKMETYYFYHQKLLRPKVVVSYEREAYVLPYDNIRITFDFKLRCDDYFNDLCDYKDARHFVQMEWPIIMEVKYNSYLPNFIKSILGSQNLTKLSISKYVLSRDHLQKRRKGLI